MVVGGVNSPEYDITYISTEEVQALRLSGDLLMHGQRSEEIEDIIHVQVQKAEFKTKCLPADCLIAIVNPNVNKKKYFIVKWGQQQAHPLAFFSLLHPFFYFCVLLLRVKKNDDAFQFVDYDPRLTAYCTISCPMLAKREKPQLERTTTSKRSGKVVFWNKPFTFRGISIADNLIDGLEFCVYHERAGFFSPPLPSPSLPKKNTNPWAKTTTALLFSSSLPCLQLDQTCKKNCGG